MTLQDFFGKYPEVAVAFSGGVDSAYLLYAAKQYARKVQAYYVKSEFQPQFELDDAVRLAEELNADLRILDLNVLAVPCVSDNPVNRCYYCKKAIFTGITRAARADDFSVLLDGTNASDDAGDRPGMKALRELSVLSPLRECGLTKAAVRNLSKEAALFTWDKPAYACLATRIPTGEKITAEKLEATESAENFLFSLGFTDFRVRSQDGNAKIQLPEDQMENLLNHRREILRELKRYYKSVVLDLTARE
ncbi:MAG: ATP-dependent sacrificial sulfur transferase LarE [Eubacteriales bacterium]|nr:ATP-dependent sacrificial sulfur transferase LarE [Eubacteriales bacterium]